MPLTPDFIMRTTLRRLLTGLALLAVGALGASCAPDITDPTSTTLTNVTITVYAGPLDVGASTNYVVTLEGDATLQVMLAGEQTLNPGVTTDVPLQIAIGTWDGTDCMVLDSNVLVPRLTAGLQRFVAAGTYCVQVADPGNLTQPIGPVVRISYPAPKRIAGTASPVTFDSVVPQGGVTSKTFVASTEGTVNITLNSLGGLDAEAGLGIGVVGTDNTQCTLARVVRTRPGASPQISVPVDAGIYCAAVLDVGNFTTSQPFSITISNP